jgi:hypothetical protein
MSTTPPPRDGWDPVEQDALGDVEHELESLRRRHESRPPLELLRAARAGVLPEELQEEAAQYLANDRAARTLLEDLENTEASLNRDDEVRLLGRIRSRLREAPAQGLGSWGWLRPLVLAGSLALVAASTWLAWRGGSRAPAIPPPEDVATRPTTPPAPVFALTLEKPPVKLSLSALTWRGAGDNPLPAALKPGLDAFRASDYVAANRELTQVAARFPQAVEPPFYQGVSRLFLDDAAGALHSLSAAARLADPSFAADVTWYLAIAAERTGKKEEARTHLSALCKGGSERAPAACATLPQLK